MQLKRIFWGILGSKFQEIFLKSVKKHRRSKSELNCIMIYQHLDGASDNEVKIEYVLGVFSASYYAIRVGRTI